MNIDKSLNSEVIGFGNSFEDIGYGVIGIKSKKVSPRDILLEIDPKYIFVLIQSYQQFGILIEE